MQTIWSQDQEPHMWDLILAVACLHVYKKKILINQCPVKYGLKASFNSRYIVGHILKIGTIWSLSMNLISDSTSL